MGLAMAFISVTLKAEQGISGIGLYLFGLGMSDLLFQLTLGTCKNRQRLSPNTYPVPLRHSGHRTNLLQPKPAGIRGLPAGAHCLVYPQ